jgi:hypothetical protein
MDRTAHAEAEATSAQQNAAKPVVTAFFDKRTCSVQYVLSDPETRHCAIIVWDE